MLLFAQSDQKKEVVALTSFSLKKKTKEFRAGTFVLHFAALPEKRIAVATTDNGTSNVTKGMRDGGIGRWSCAALTC